MLGEKPSKLKPPVCKLVTESSSLRSMQKFSASGDDDKALQEHLDRFHVCLDLCYRLVFLLIGYEGRHTDYGTKEWPTHAFRLGGEITATAPTTNEPVIPPENRPEDAEREAV